MWPGSLKSGASWTILSYMSEVTTAFYTEAHRIEGELSVTERLSEKLNDPLTDYIELRDVRITSLLHDAGGPAVNWPVATIPKATILLATLDMVEHESRQTRIDKVQSKQGSEVGAIVGLDRGLRHRSFEVLGRSNAGTDHATAVVLSNHRRNNSAEPTSRRQSHRDRLGARQPFDGSSIHAVIIQ